MTTITVYRRPDGLLTGFIAQGHATEGARRGKDIVCSAVSALTQTAVNAIETVAGVPTQPTVDDGLLELHLPGALTDEQERVCDIILRTVMQGLTDIEQSYPKQVRVLCKEWRKHHVENESPAVRA